jgi:hypothetical protein
MSHPIEGGMEHAMDKIYVEYRYQDEAEQDALREQLYRRSPALHQKLAAAKRPRTSVEYFSVR